MLPRVLQVPLAGTQSAEAEIHYSGVINERFGRSPVNYEHSVLPLRHSARLSFIEDTYDWLFGIDGGAVSNRFCGYLSRRRAQLCLAPFLKAWWFQIVSFLPSGGFRYGVLFNTSLFAGGQFYPNGIGFIGFRFNNGAGIQYGWARLEMRSFAGNVAFTSQRSFAHHAGGLRLGRSGRSNQDWANHLGRRSGRGSSRPRFARPARHWWRGLDGMAGQP